MTPALCGPFSIHCFHFHFSTEDVCKGFDIYTHMYTTFRISIQFTYNKFIKELEARTEEIKTKMKLFFLVII